VCPGGTQLKTTGGGMLEEVAMKKNAMTQPGSAAQMDAAAASMHALEEGSYSQLICIAPVFMQGGKNGLVDCRGLK